MAPLHKRFDEADEAAIDQPAPTAEESDMPSSDDDDDEAPEAVSTTTAHSATLSAQRKIAQSVTQAATAEKTRRKQREEKLAAQTKKSRSRRPDSGAQEGSESEDSDDDETATPLLPMNVLAAAERAAKMQEEAEFRAGVPQNVRKRRFLDADPKPVGDKKVGRTKVRVLAEAPTGLPPKASGQGRSVREGWLAQRKGRGSQGAGRKVATKGFVTK